MHGFQHDTFCFVLHPSLLLTLHDPFSLSSFCPSYPDKNTGHIYIKVAPSVSYKHANIPLQDCSCCTVIAEKFVHNSPEILAGRGFSRLLVLLLLYTVF